MKDRCVITVGREFGSGGREIAKKLAERLQFPFYDRELITLAAEKSGINVNVFETADERPQSSLLYSLAVDPYSVTGSLFRANNMQTNDQLFKIQSDVIREVAAAGSCVIVGRCADYILQELPECLRIYVHGSMDHRIDRIKRLYELTGKQARELIQKTDKSRASYYNFYTEQKWGDADNFHLSIDPYLLGTDGTVDLLETFVKAFMAQ